MVEGDARDQMIEIGDPTEEPTAPESPPQVVIEYRERGVPWMLIPPLLMISAMGSILGYHKFGPKNHPTPVAVAVKVPEAPTPDPVVSNSAPTPAPALEATLAPAPAVDLPTIPDPVPNVPPVAVVETPAAETLPPVEAPTTPEPEAKTNPSPRLQGLGFDPMALEADKKPGAPADPELAPAGQPVRDETPANPPDLIARPAERDKPEEVDPDLLPPDPKLARARQQQRLAEALKLVEADRTRFHADVRSICREFRERSAPELINLIKRYESKVEPLVEKRAAQLLGKTGHYVGASQPARIKLLRSLGYPEPAILQDIFIFREKERVHERGGAHNEAEAFYFAALYLLNYPPNPAPTNSRPVSTTRPSAVVGPIAPGR